MPSRDGEKVTPGPAEGGLGSGPGVRFSGRVREMHAANADSKARRVASCSWPLVHTFASNSCVAITRLRARQHCDGARLRLVLLRLPGFKHEGTPGLRDYDAVDVRADL